MSITITITDPHLVPPDELRRLVTYLDPHMVRGDLVTIAPVAEVKRPSIVEGRKRAEAVAAAISQFTEAEHKEQPTNFGVVAPPPPAPLDLSAFSAEDEAPRSGFVTGPTISVPPSIGFGDIYATTPPPSPGLDLDVAGLPWDGRIHSSSKSKNLDGTWRVRRNLNPIVEASVVAQLRAAMGAPVVAVVPPPPPAPSAAPVEPSAPAAPTFAEFMKLVTKQNQADPTFIPRTTAECVKMGLPNLAALYNRPDLLVPVMRAMGFQV